MKQNSTSFIIHAYRLTDDSGNAPCIHSLDGKQTDMLTLACCKGGQIRNEKGILTGLRYKIGRNHEADIANKSRDVYLMGIYKDTLLYFAQITEIVLMEDYYASDSRYKNRRDAIYDFADGIFTRNNHNPCFHPKNVPERHKRDQLGKYVLMSNHFAYWGKESQKIPDDIVRFLPAFRESKSYCASDDAQRGMKIMNLMQERWNFKENIQNEPHSLHRTCHRKGCASKCE